MTAKYSDPETNSGGDIITDHAFIARPSNIHLCGYVRPQGEIGVSVNDAEPGEPVMVILKTGRCDLAQAAHKTSEAVYITDRLPYRCPDCVTKGIDPCQHQGGVEELLMVKTEKNFFGNVATDLKEGITHQSPEFQRKLYGEPDPEVVNRCQRCNTDKDLWKHPLSDPAIYLCNPCKRILEP
jgi:hypothetical protein